LVDILDKNPHNFSLFSYFLDYINNFLLSHLEGDYSLLELVSHFCCQQECNVEKQRLGLSYLLPHNHLIAHPLLLCCYNSGFFYFLEIFCGYLKLFWSFSLQILKKKLLFYHLLYRQFTYFAYQLWLLTKNLKIKT